MRIRKATQADRETFLRLWSEFLTENRKTGSEILPTQRTLDFFGTVFDHYVSEQKDSAPGVCLLAGANCGVLLWGKGADLPFDTEHDPIAQGWGTYVRQSNRGRGVSRQLRERAIKILSSMGFRSVIGTVVNQNEAGVVSGDHAGFDLYAQQGILRLE